MSKLITTVSIILLAASTAHAADGLIVLKSNHPIKETVARLEKALDEKGMTVFAKIDHAAGAQKAGMVLDPAVLVVFGNPKVGTKLMQCSRTVAIDMPQKALIWEDDNGQTWYGYNDPRYLMKRHGNEDCEKPADKIGNALANFARAATE